MVDSVIKDRKEGRTAVKSSGGGYDLLQLLLEAAGYDDRGAVDGCGGER